MDKLTKQETVERFRKLSEKYGVLDYLKSGGTHDRFYLGKLGPCKPLFLACSRVGWVCVYIDKPEMTLLSNNGFQCETVASDDERYEYKTRVDAEKFDCFLKLVNGYLNNRPSKQYKELMISKNEIINDLIFKVYKNESIALDLISLFGDSEFEDSLYTEAFFYLERLIKGSHLERAQKICIVIALALVALKEYDGDLHSHIEINSRLFFENKKYPYSPKIRDAIYSVLGEYRPKMKYYHPNSYVAVPVIMSCSPYYRVYDLFKLSYYIYKRKLLFDEDINDEQIYDKVKATFIALRKKDVFDDAADSSDGDKIKGTEYRMCRYTQSCIYSGVEFDALIRIVTKCIRLIINHIVLSEDSFTVDEYFKQGYELWTNDFDNDDRTQYEQNRSISRPYFVLYNREIYLVTGEVEFDDSLDPNDVHIMLYCNGERIDDYHVNDPNYIEYADPNDVLSGFVVRRCTIPLKCNPLDNLHYTVEVSGQVVYSSKNKLFRQVAFFDGNGKEIKAGKEYDGEVYVLTKYKNDDEYGDKIKTYREGNGYYLSTIEINSKDVFRFDGEPYVFYKIEGSKFLGYCVPNIEFESMEKKRYAVYSTAVILFPASCELEDISVSVDGQRYYYDVHDEIWFSARVFSNRSDGNLVYSVKIFDLDSGYHEVKVINSSTGKEIKGASFSFVLDPDYRSQYKRTTTTSLEYDLESSIIDEQTIEYKFGVPQIDFSAFVKNLGHGKIIMYPPFISYSYNNQEWYGINTRFCLCDVDESIDRLTFCGPRDLKAYYTNPKSTGAIKETNLKKDDEYPSKYSLSLDYLRANNTCKKVYFVYGNYNRYLLINPTPYIIAGNSNFYFDKDKNEHHFTIRYDSVGEVYVIITDLITKRVIYCNIIRSGVDLIIPDTDIPLTVKYLSVSLHMKKSNSLFDSYETEPFYTFPKYEIERFFFSVPADYPKIKFNREKRIIAIKFKLQGSDSALLRIKPTGKYLTKIIYSKVINNDEVIRIDAKLTPFDAFDILLYPANLSDEELELINPVYIKSFSIESPVLRKTFYIRKFITDNNKIISAGYHIYFIRMEEICGKYFIVCTVFNKVKRYRYDDVVVRLEEIDDKRIVASIRMKNGNGISSVKLGNGTDIKKIIIDRAEGVNENE